MAFWRNRHQAGRAATARSVRWFALLLLLFNVVVGAVLPGTANARGNSYPDLDAAMVVCTAAGMVVLDHDSPSTEVRRVWWRAA